MKLFAAFFSFFFLYFLHNTEAKAAAFHSDSRYVQERGAAVISKSAQGKLETNNWLQWPGLVSEQFHFSALEFLCTTATRTFTAISAKDFYIKTGLSPPLLFV